MPASSGPNRRYVTLLVFASIVACILFIGTFRNLTQGTRQVGYDTRSSDLDLSEIALQDDLLTGHSIAPKLGNETAKAELGRAAWKLFHTTFARFPDKPTADESAALKTYIHLFQRLYPCGECSSHFRKILDKYPPQVSSRSAAAVWGCHVHNEVNKSLKKPIFDCSQIGDFYDCGCADDEEEEGSTKAAIKDKAKTLSKHTSADETVPVELHKEEFVSQGTALLMRRIIR